MKILSVQNPIIIDNKRVNDDSQYLSAEGINVVLNSPAKTKAFQDWMDTTHAGWVQGKNLNKGGGYGNNGPSTSTAWKSYGEEFVSISKNMMGLGPKPTLPPEVSATDPKGNKKAGMVWDKAKGIWAKADEYGITDKVLGFFGITKPGQTQTQPTNEIGTVGNVDTTDPNAGKKPLTPEEIAAAKKKKTIIIISVVAGVLILATVVILVMKSKAKKSAVKPA